MKPRSILAVAAVLAGFLSLGAYAADAQSPRTAESGATKSQAQANPETTSGGASQKTPTEGKHEDSKTAKRFKDTSKHLHPRDK